jgi:hypothetical protein
MTNPEQPTNHVLLAATGQIRVTGMAANMIVVSRPEELPAALSQRAKPVVIENAELTRKFGWMEFWQGREATYRYIATLIFALLALAMVLQYKISLGWQQDWTLGRSDGKITLTPTR